MYIILQVSLFLFLQIEYFGLQYSNKNYQLRWVDLEKPLKKQLEKYTQDPVLKFGVMLYAPNMESLKQEITRYELMWHCSSLWSSEQLPSYSLCAY